MNLRVWQPALAEHARRALETAGYPVTVVTGDGANGYPPRAPFDRVIATAAVALGRLPYAWIAQTRAGGRIVTPLRTDLARGGPLVSLTVHTDGTATGRFVGRLGFMPLRQHRRDRPEIRDIELTPAADTSTTTLKVWRTVETWDAHWAVSVAVPSCAWNHIEHDGKHELWFVDPTGPSWAVASYDAEPGARTVRQHGPRRLWDEIETAYRNWSALGKPAFDRYGITVTARSQAVWLDEPDNIVAESTDP
ncbi:hypothetical protein GCM10012275_03980 [Longimycelium tulufanense]|uniref:Protein-L-isoaspartate O-methyltransferase n=1 Tax=Longimycelium tulufanense TaxID=907463 RepID=A0A8J3FT59_9PSEU|nr:hypothetical protein [Longimycelium tulufanense]GGM35919.1 hypothetical protein GCM10012275_03980 [Longimycelium tulufanense]